MYDMSWTEFIVRLLLMLPLGIYAYKHRED